MNNLSKFYKDFLKYKIKSPTTYLNLIKKVHSYEDLKYTLGLMRLAKNMVLKRKITNETIRGR